MITRNIYTSKSSSHHTVTSNHHITIIIIIVIIIIVILITIKQAKHRSSHNRTSSHHIILSSSIITTSCHHHHYHQHHNVVSSSGSSTNRLLIVTISSASHPQRSVHPGAFNISQGMAKSEPWSICITRILTIICHTISRIKRLCCAIHSCSLSLICFWISVWATGASELTTNMLSSLAS